MKEELIKILDSYDLSYIQREKQYSDIANEILALFSVVGHSEQLVCPFCQSDDLFEFELKHSKCRKCKEQWTN